MTEKELREIEKRAAFFQGVEGHGWAREELTLCTEVRRLVKALADTRKHLRTVSTCLYLRSATGQMLDRALEGYEVDDA